MHLHKPFEQPPPRPLPPPSISQIDHRPLSAPDRHGEPIRDSGRRHDAPAPDAGALHPRVCMLAAVTVVGYFRRRVGLVLPRALAYTGTPPVGFAAAPRLFASSRTAPANVGPTAAPLPFFSAASGGSGEGEEDEDADADEGEGENKASSGGTLAVTPSRIASAR